MWKKIDAIEKEMCAQNRANNEKKIREYNNSHYIVTRAHGLQTLAAYEVQREIDGLAAYALMSENMY
jgi:hypothetical protein